MSERIHGEGNHEAGHKYQRETEKFTESGKVEKNAKEAAHAVEEKGEELERARKETKAPTDEDER